MKIVNKILLIIVFAIALVGCRKDELFLENGNNSSSPDGKVRIDIDLSKLGYSNNKFVTRSATTTGATIATAEELNVDKGIYVMVFDNSKGTKIKPDSLGGLLEIRQVDKSETVESGAPVGAYYTNLESRTSAVRLVGLANLPPNLFGLFQEILNLNLDNNVSADETFSVNTAAAYEKYLDTDRVTGKKYFSYLSMLRVVNNIEYSTDISLYTDKDNVEHSYSVLHPSGGANYLPIYMKSYCLDKFTQDYVDSEIKAGNAPAPVFAYTRIDVQLRDSVDTRKMKLLEYWVTDAPRTFSSSFKPEITRTGKKSIVVTSEMQANYPAEGVTSLHGRYPEGINKNNFNTHYLRGLYVMPTYPLEGTPHNQVSNNMAGAATYVMLKVQKPTLDHVGNVIDSIGEPVYYKIMLEYYHPSVKNQKTFFLHNNDRLLIYIKDFDSPGYSNLGEALAAPPSNIDYNITLDEFVTDLEANGQYLLAVQRENYVSNSVSHHSNFVYEESVRDYIDNAVEDFQWASDRTLKFTITTQAGDEDGNHNPISPDSLVMEILGKSDSVTLEYVKGEKCYDNKKIVTKNEDGTTTITYDKKRYTLSTTGEPNDNIRVVGTDPYADNAAWKTYFGIHTFKIKLPENHGIETLKFRMGELSRSLKFGLTRELVTDYTDVNFVNTLVKGQGGVAATHHANSYIINSTGDSDINTYYIPVEYTILRYWSNYASPTKFINFSTWSNKTNSLFEVEQSWFDSHPTDSTYNPLKSDDVTKDGTGPITYERVTMSSGVKAIKISFTGAQLDSLYHQNVGLNVKYNSEIVWSWHLWITDYNPYRDSEGNVPTGSGNWSSVSVTGGKVQTYNNWGSKYGTRVMMDRNLGAIEEDVKRNELYYQIGRKDPFPENLISPDDVFPIIGQSAKPSASSFVERKRNFTTSADDCVSETYVSSGRGLLVSNFNETVSEPQKLFSATNDGYGWSSSGYGFNYMWLDNRSLLTMNNPTKSIFDPSPLGWMVPYKTDTWDGLGGLSKQISNEHVVFTSGTCVIRYPISAALSGFTGLTTVAQTSDQWNVFGKDAGFAFSASSAFLVKVPGNPAAAAYNMPTLFGYDSKNSVAYSNQQIGATSAITNQHMSKHAFPVRPIQE